MRKKIFMLFSIIFFIFIIYSCNKTSDKKNQKTSLKSNLTTTKNQETPKTSNNNNVNKSTTKTTEQPQNLPKGISFEQYEAGLKIPDEPGIYDLSLKAFENDLIPYKMGLYWLDGIGIVNGKPKYINPIDFSIATYVDYFAYDHPDKDESDKITSDFDKKYILVQTYSNYTSFNTDLRFTENYFFKIDNNENANGLILQFDKDKDNKYTLDVYSINTTKITKDKLNWDFSYIKSSYLNKYTLIIKFIGNDLYLSDDNKSFSKLELKYAKRIKKTVSFTECYYLPVWVVYLKCKWFEGEYYIYYTEYE